MAHADVPGGSLQLLQNQILMTGRLPLVLLLVITGAHAQLQDEAKIQSSTSADPNVVKISDYSLKVVAVTILTIGVAVAGWIFNYRPLAPTIPAAVPKTPAVPAAVIALPIIPIVEGDDIDDVLARAPTPTRLNSPLSWL